MPRLPTSVLTETKEFDMDTPEITNKENDILVEDYDEFAESFTTFTQRNGSLQTLTDKKEWFNKVQKTHSGLREFIGGIRRSRMIETNQGQKLLTKEQTRPIFNKLQGVFSGVISESILTSSLIKDGTHKAHKATNKIRSTICQCLDSSLRNGDMSEYVSAQKRIDLNNTMAELGQLWAKAKCDKRQIKVTLSTAAIAFLMLGHYRVDHDSCFGNDGVSRYAKLSVGQSDNTFVITLEENDTIVGRCWGFTTDDFSTFHTSNLYLSTMEEGTFTEAVKDFFIDLFGSEIHISLNKTRIGHGIFHNPYARFSFSTLKNPDFVNWQPDSYIEEYNCCSRCGDKKPLEWHNEKQACKDCCENLELEFDIHNYIYTNKLEPVYENDEQLYISSLIRSKDYTPCNRCTKYTKSDTVYQLNNRMWCEKCYNEHLLEKIKNQPPKIEVKEKEPIKITCLNLKKKKEYEFSYAWPVQQEEE